MSAGVTGVWGIDLDNHMLYRQYSQSAFSSITGGYLSLVYFYGVYQTLFEVLRAEQEKRSVCKSSTVNEMPFTSMLFDSSEFDFRDETNYMTWQKISISFYQIRSSYGMQRIRCKILMCFTDLEFRWRYV